MRATLLVLGLCYAAGAGPDGAIHGQKVASIIAAIEAREKATGAFCAEYYETCTCCGNRRMGPRFFAWSPDKSLYRGPELGNAVPVLGWFTKDKVERDSLYFRDRTQSFWLHLETEPVPLVWNGTRGRSRGPDFRPETGFFWQRRPISAFLGIQAVMIVGNEAVDGDPCVKLLVHDHDKGDGRAPWPQLLWLSKACGYFPRRLVDHRITHQDTVRPTGPALRIRDWFCYATEEYRWEDLRRKGQAWYPMRIRIETIGFEPGSRRLIEVVEGSARFGDEVTDQDFELPGLYFLKDNITGGYVAVTPLARITLEAALALAAAALLLLLFRIRRRRRGAT